MRIVIKYKGGDIKK